MESQAKAWNRKRFRESQVIPRIAGDSGESQAILWERMRFPITKLMYLRHSLSRIVRSFVLNSNVSLQLQVTYYGNAAAIIRDTCETTTVLPATTV